MPDTKKAFYTVIGAGKFVVDGAKNLVDATQAFLAKRQKDALRTYRDLSKRGEKVVTSIRRSAPAKRANERTKAARSAVKGATSSVRKAAEANIEAARSAVQKVS